MKNLPNVKLPEFPITLPLSKRTIKIRPFMASEEKILLMALETTPIKEETIKNALEQILRGCIVSKINIDTLTNVDVEYIFLQLRKISVSETIDIVFNLREAFGCSQDKCVEQVKVSIRIDDIPQVNLTDKKIIKINEDVGVVLAPLRLSQDLPSGEMKSEIIFKLIATMIESIYEKENVIDVSGNTIEELTTWLENSFGHAQIKEAIDFISNQPTHEKEITVTCSLCGKEKKHTARGIVDFFM